MEWSSWSLKLSLEYRDWRFGPDTRWPFLTITIPLLTLNILNNRCLCSAFHISVGVISHVFYIFSVIFVSKWLDCYMIDPKVKTWKNLIEKWAESGSRLILSFFFLRCWGKVCTVQSFRSSSGRCSCSAEVFTRICSVPLWGNRVKRQQSSLETEDFIIKPKSVYCHFLLLKCDPGVSFISK